MQTELHDAIISFHCSQSLGVFSFTSEVILSVPLTNGAAPHVRAQFHAVRAGARVPGGVLCNLWGLQTEVLTSSVRQTAHVTGVRG